MPTKPKRLCSRCQQVVSGPCERCNKQREVQYDKWRGSAASRGYDARWSAYSKARLSEHPLCVDCEAGGRLEAATLTGHIVPGWVDMERFWDSSNHKSQCASCNAKQDHEDRKRYASALT